MKEKKKIEFRKFARDYNFDMRKVNEIVKRDFEIIAADLTRNKENKEDEP